MKPNTPTNTIIGSITGLYGDVLHGWAADLNEPCSRLVIEIVIDGASVALVRADEYCPKAGHGDQFNGFSVQLKENWLSKASIISARIANRSTWLDGTVVCPISRYTDVPAAASQVWYTGGLKIHGWAWDLMDLNRIPTITIRTDKEFLCRTKANKKRHVLAHFPIQERSFEVDLPWQLANGDMHTLHIEDERGQALTGSPVKLCIWPEGLEALIRSNGSPVKDSTELDLLTVVARHQEVLIPRSASFASYHQWYAAFQVPENLDLASLNSQACGVLILSQGDYQLEEISIASARTLRVQPRLIVASRPDNISDAIAQLAAAGCRGMIPLVAGDRLAPHALDHLVKLLEHGALWAYGDCDQDGPNGERTNPWLKPVWDIDLFIGSDVYSTGCIIALPALLKCCSSGPLSELNAPLSWHDALAKIVYATYSTGSRPVHIPRILYHRHPKRLTNADNSSEAKARVSSIEWLANAIAPGATIELIEGTSGLLNARWPLPENLPKVSVIIPTRDQFELLYNCVEGLLNNTRYPNIEIIIVDNESADPATLDYLHRCELKGIRVVPHPHPFNYSAVNNCAAKFASGDFLCLLNNDIEIISETWLEEMIRLITRADIGIVGAKLLWPNKMVQHGGVIIGVNGLAAHAGNFLEQNEKGYLDLNILTHEKSAVTGACMLISKTKYEELLGLDEDLFPVAFNDIDLCLRLRKHGKRILWCSQSQLIHAESASRGKDVANEKRARARREQNNFLESHSEYIMRDTHYHPGLTLDFVTGPYNGLSMPPRALNPRI